MKKALSLLIAVTLLLAGCSPGQREVTAADLLGKPFGCRMDFNVVGVKFSGEFIKTDTGKMSLVLSEPETLSGLTFAYDSGSVSLSMFGLTVALDTEGLPSAAASELLFNLYSGGGQNRVELTGDRIILTHTGRLDTLTLEFDRGTQVPLTLRTENSGVEISYSDYRLL